MIAGTRRHLGPKVRGLRHCELNSVANAQHPSSYPIHQNAEPQGVDSVFLLRLDEGWSYSADEAGKGGQELRGSTQPVELFENERQWMLCLVRQFMAFSRKGVLT